MEFSNVSCDLEFIDPYNESQLGVKNITWIDETTVNIRAYISLNCAYWIEGAGFHIHNSTISLSYFVGRQKHGTGILMANCICAASLNFTLSNLEPGEYNFELEPLFNDHPEE